MAWKQQRLPAVIRGINRLSGDCRGITALALALMVLPTVGLMGLVVDSVMVYTAQNNMRTALDAAALAAAQASSETRQAVAERYFNANSRALAPLVEGEVTLTVTEEDGLLSLDADARVPTSFMQLFGFTGVPVRAGTSVQRSLSGTVELALVLDASGSMWWNSRITALRQAATDLVNILFGGENSTTGVRMSIIPYSAAVRIGRWRNGWARGNFADWFFWFGCVENRVNGEQGDAPPSNGGFQIAFALAGCSREILPLTSNPDTLRGYIGGLNVNFASFLTGWTRGDYGMLWGWRTLSPRWRNDWGIGDIADYQTPGVEKIAVLISDGASQDSHANSQQAAVCSDMKSLGIVIYTIAIAPPNSQARQKLSDCASSTDHFFESANETVLQEAFGGIADEITTLRIIR